MTDKETIERMVGRPLAWTIDPLLAGVPAAGRLITAKVGPELVWSCCRELYRARTAPRAFRALFSALWVLDHPRVKADTGRDTLAAMLEFGEFERLGGDVATVWRGGQGQAAETVAAGWSWSTSYRWAAWFAVSTVPGEPGGAPSVVVAEVPPGQCYIVPGRLSELAGEVLLVEPPASVLVAGSPVEWEAEAAKAEATRLASRPLGLLADAGEVLRWAVSSTGTEGAA